MIEVDSLSIPLFSALVGLLLMWWRDWHVTHAEIDSLEYKNHLLSEKHDDLVDLCKTLKGSRSTKKILKDIDEFVNTEVDK